MSNIDAQIKALLLKKKKIDYVSYIADLIKNDTKCIDFKDVQEEVISKVEPFLLGLMESIEKDTEVSVQKSEIFSDEEIKILKLLVQKASSRPSSQINPNSQSFSKEQKPVSPKRNDMSNSDKMNFALSNRHLANKKVQVLNDQNAQIFGSVVGLDAPYVIVKTETGPTINVPLEKIVLV